MSPKPHLVLLGQVGRWQRKVPFINPFHGKHMHWNNCDAVEQDSQRLSGAWLFVGTRVPVAALFENLRAGATIDQFIDWFPGVTKAQVLNVLQHVRMSLSENASRS